MARYAISDLHGRFDLYQEVEKFRKSGDRIICLGDCGDRGPQSIETLTAVADNPNWICLMGNHEHMTMEALKESILDRPSGYYTPSAFDVSCSNGGMDTITGMAEDPTWWFQYLSKLKYRIDFRNDKGYDLILTHAGFDITDPAPTEWDYIWNRSHINMPWPEHSKEFDNFVMIHGHTPIPLIEESWKVKDGSYFYASGHKINIDAGSVWTGGAILLDLDTFDEHIFEIGNSNENN